MMTIRLSVNFALKFQAIAVAAAKIFGEGILPHPVYDGYLLRLAEATKGCTAKHQGSEFPTLWKTLT